MLFHFNVKTGLTLVVAAGVAAAVLCVGAGAPATAAGLYFASPYPRALTTVPGTGRTYTAISFASYSTQGYFIGKNRVDFAANSGAFSPREMTQDGGMIYHEYGLSDVSAVSVTLPYIRSDHFTWNGVTQPDQDGVGDITARYRYLAITGDFNVALAMGFKAPGAYDPLRLNVVGKGQTDLFLEAAVGKTIVKDLYTEISAGYRWRLGVPDNEMTLGVELGWKSPFGLTPRAFYNVDYGLDGLDINMTNFNAASGVMGLPATREIRDVWGLGLNYDYKSFDFGFTYADVVDGRNTDDGRTFTVSAGMRY